MSSNKILLLLFVATLLIPNLSTAQQPGDIEWVISSEVIKKGVAYHDDEEYDKAIAQYSKINQSDSLYAIALYEKALSCQAGEKYEDAIKYAWEGISLKSAQDHEFYQILGNSLDLSGKYEEAQKVYDAGIEKYPLYANYWYEKGVSHVKHKQDEEAVQCFQKGIKLNPFYANCHLALGMLAVKHDKPSFAFLALQNFFLLESGTPRSVAALASLDSVAQRKKVYNPDSLITFPGKGDDFSELDKLIRDKKALLSTYKSKVKVDNVGLAKTMQSFFENLKYDKNDPGFFMQTYAPYQEEVQNKGQFKAFIFKAFQGVDDKNVIKAQKKYAIPMAQVERNYLIDQKKKMKEGPEGFSKPYGRLEYHYSDEGTISAIGNTFENNGQLYTRGKWYFLYPSGNVALEGLYDDNANRHSIWKAYYPHNIIKEETTFAGGSKNGEYKLYYPDGSLQQKHEYRADRVVGTVENYYRNGGKSSDIPFKDQLRDGEMIEYFENGVIKGRTQYKEGHINGEAKTYYNNGMKKLEAGFQNDKLHGPFVTYYYYGSKELEGSFITGERDGIWKTYHDNGQLKKIQSYSNGLLRDTVKEYSKTGVLERYSVYTKKGNEIFTADFDESDGKLFSEVKSGKYGVSGLKYYNKEGATIYEAANKKSTMSVEGFYPNGTKRFEGKILSGKRTGTWTFFTRNGAKDEMYVYVNGVTNGSYQSYFSNGVIYIDGNMQNGERDGLYKFAYRSGVLSAKGYYRDGIREGEWLNYNELGTITARVYYVNGELTGLQEYYHPNGVLRKTIESFPNKLETVNYHDTTGKIYQTLELKPGNDVWTEKFMNGKTWFESPIVNGTFDGEAIIYHPNGKVYTKMNEKNGLRQGDVEEFYPDGKKLLVGTYKDGNREGIWVKFDTDGDTLSKIEYKQNLRHGHQVFYHSNGKRSTDYTFVEGNYEGYGYRYSQNGELLVRFHFSRNIVDSYSYMDEQGKMKSEIPIKNETADVVAYYPNGNKSAVMTYTNGWHMETSSFYHSNGKLAEVRTYENGEEQNVRKEYTDKGTLLSEEDFKDGELHGKCRYYYPDGKLRSECEYYLGKKHGLEKSYDPQGKLVAQYDYVFDYAYPVNTAK